MPRPKTMSYDTLQEVYEEASYMLVNEMKDNSRLRDEIEYLSDFICWKELEEEYIHFKENAVRDPNDNLPFPRYILK